MNRSKTTGTEGIGIERLAAFEALVFDRIREIINKICDFGDIPEDISRYVFIALPKKASA